MPWLCPAGRKILAPPLVGTTRAIKDVQQEYRPFNDGWDDMPSPCAYASITGFNLQRKLPRNGPCCLCEIVLFFFVLCSESVTAYGCVKLFWENKWCHLVIITYSNKAMSMIIVIRHVICRLLNENIFWLLIGLVICNVHGSMKQDNVDGRKCLQRNSWILHPHLGRLMVMCNDLMCT